MKKFCITIFLFLILVVSVIGFAYPKQNVKTEYLRIHVRANSNLDIDQNVKYLVKDAVVDYLTPFIAECKTKKQAENMLVYRKKGIEQTANGVLKAEGFSYKSSAEIKTELFPTRVYEGLTLESGYYDALILNLGSGEGDNWWCVVYPPLCFVGEGNGYVYKSKIYQVIEDFFSKNKEE